MLNYGYGCYISVKEPALTEFNQEEDIYFWYKFLKGESSFSCVSKF